MRVWRFGLCAVLALAVVGGVHGAEEADEFDDIDTVAAQETVAPAKPEFEPEELAMSVEEASAAAKPTWQFEKICGAIVGMYLTNFFLGKKTNRKLADAWLAKAEPTFKKEFAYTAASAEPPIGLLEESKTNFKYYCTGRRYCARMIADLQFMSRHDLFIRLIRIVKPTPEYLTLDVGLNSTDLDPIVFCVAKKTGYNDLTKTFPELLALTKRIDSDVIPSSMWLNADNHEILQLALTKQFLQQLTELEPFLEFVVVTDVNSIPVIGLPKIDRSHLLRLRFRMFAGSKTLNSAAAVSLMTFIIDAIGTKWKVSREVKATAQKKRSKWQQERRADEVAEKVKEEREQPKQDKKREEYKKLSYEEQQKLDEHQQKKQLRKRFSKKR